MCGACTRSFHLPRESALLLPIDEFSMIGWNIINAIEKHVKDDKSVLYELIGSSFDKFIDDIW